MVDTEFSAETLEQFFKDAEINSSEQAFIQDCKLPHSLKSPRHSGAERKKNKALAQ
jgi:hypothetical protein